MLRVTNLLIVCAIACGGTTKSNQVPAPTAGAGFTVQLPATTFLNDLEDRDRREQMRDWGVLATLAHEGATPEQTAAATYQMPAARLPYLDELYTFTYGRGRRAYFGERVLLFVDVDDPDRIATIGRLADQVRMELGEIPRSAEVYVVEDQRNEGTLHITRSADVEGAQLFSPEYGYVEAGVADADQLATWLSKIDDLTRVRIEPGKLMLGGRRFAKSRTEGVTVEDIAALYQAPARIHDRKAAAKRELEGLAAKYEAEYKQRLATEGYAEDGFYSEAEQARLLQAAKRISEELAAAALKTASAAAERAGGSDEPGFSLDPHWLPTPDGKHPLMLARLQQLAKDPCAEITRIARLAPKLLAAEPDESRRSMEAWAASEVATTKIAAPTCTWLRGFIGKQLLAVTTALEAAQPQNWRDGFGPYFQLRADLTSRAELTDAQRDALFSMRATLVFHEAETGAQCARYDGIEGTAVGMTLFYTDLLAKLWQSVDYGHSAPLRAIPGFLTKPRVDISPAFADELERLPDTRTWFAPRTDGWSRIAADSASELAFVHRFSRVYAAGSDPANPGQESTPNEQSRLSIGWWDRHFDEIADHEQQYHRQNQIMKWSAVVAAMLETREAPGFLASIEVERTARFFPWLAAHRDQLRFKEPIPERHTPYSTECIALLQSYPYTTAGGAYSISGGVSLANTKVVKAAPILHPTLPRGQRVVPAEGTTPLPRRALEGRTVLVEDAATARVRSSTGPMSLHGVSAHFEGNPGTPSITMDSEAGKLTTVTFGRTNDSVQIDMHAGPVEHVRAVLAGGDQGTSISFEGRPEHVVERGGTLVEVKPTTEPSPDGVVTATAHDTFRPGWPQARAANADELHAQMDEYAWQVVKPGKDATDPPTVHFRNEPPPADARTVPVRGLPDITTAHVTSDGEVFFARPVKPSVRERWHGLFHWINARPDQISAPQRPGGLIDLLPLPSLEQERRQAEHLARRGHLEAAAPLFAHTLPKEPATIEDRAHEALRNVAVRHATAARRALESLAARGHEVSPQTRALLVESLRNHGDGDVAGFLDTTLTGNPAPAGMSLTEDRGRVTVRYEARQIETFEITDTAEDMLPSLKYFDPRMLVGREGFEPDFSGSIARWRDDPNLSVREMKANPLELTPGVIVETSTGKEYRRARDPAATQIASEMPGLQRVYVIAPRSPPGNQQCNDASGKGCSDEH